jgi:aryl-alcohol dehydrogenase-like predicted oxidoreductase
LVDERCQTRRAADPSVTLVPRLGWSLSGLPSEHHEDIPRTTIVEAEPSLDPGMQPGAVGQDKSVRTVPLGEAGVDVSALCLGCMFFGTRVDAEKSIRLLDTYTETGGSFLDTANNYAYWIEDGQGGESEDLLGCWLRRRGNRDRLFLATKVGAAPGEDLSGAAIRAAVDGSLRRLQTDWIDLYYAHVDDRSVALEETLAAFGELVTAGKVRHIGCSNYAAWRLERARRISDALALPRYCCIQQRHTYLRPRPGTDFGVQLVADEGLLDYCDANPEVSLLAYSPLLSGSYARPGRPLPEQYLGADTDARLDALRRVATETGASSNQVVLAWLMATTPSAIPLVSASSETQLEENLAAVSVELEAEQLATLDAAAA